MKEEDFVFTIGYQSDSAIIDGKAQKQFKSFSFSQLLEEGMFKAAFCKALFHDDEEGQRKVLAEYNAQSGAAYESIDSLKRLFGVFGVPEGVTKITVV